MTNTPTVTAQIGGRPLRFAYAIRCEGLPFVVWRDVLNVARVGFFARRLRTLKLVRNWDEKFLRRVNVDGRGEIAVTSQMAAAVIASQAVAGRVGDGVCEDFSTALNRIIVSAFLATAPADGSA